MRVQQVLMPDGSESWTVLGDDGRPVPPVERFARLRLENQDLREQLARQLGAQRAAANTRPG